MKLFGLNITRSAPAPTAAPAQKSFSSAAWLRGDDIPNHSQPLHTPYEQIAWVYRAATVLAEQIANTPFLFSRGERGRENLITSGPLIDFYEQPHPNIDRFQYWELRVLWLLLRGECFRVPIFDGRKLVSILILNPEHFSPLIQDHDLKAWRYKGFPTSTPLHSQTLLPDEVWHEKLSNPYNFWRGLSPLNSAEVALKTDYAASIFMHGLIENNGDLGTIVRTADSLDDAQKEQIVAAIRNRRNGCGSPARPLLLWSSCEIVKPSISSADLQFIENRKFSRSEICAALGVPEEIVSTTDHNKYDVMQGARLNFIENRVAPLCARLAAAEQRVIRHLDPSAVGWFDLDSLPIMQQAWRTRLAAAKTGFDMGIPFNELNRTFDLGFRALPHGDTCYLSKNLQPVGQLASGVSALSLEPQASSKDMPLDDESLELIKDLCRRMKQNGM